MRAVRVHRVHRACLIAALAALLAACGSDSHSIVDYGPATPDPEVRARQVATAWDGSPAAEAWREGYHPMADSSQWPDGTPQKLTLRGELPALPRESGRVAWSGGGSLPLPLLPARTAYDALDLGDPGAARTVTGARLGTMTQLTSRGPATVPAWLFTVEGYDTPLKRAAVAPSAPPERPIGPAAEEFQANGVLSQVDRLVEVSDEGRSVTVIVMHGSCDDGARVDVLETDGSVVLSASVTGVDDGPCDASLHAEKVTVRPAAPLGDRMLLDAFTGLPVPYGSAEGPSLSWS
ncbi:hypothetical protein ACWD25_52710 [Streptomyces sp. NPDC002920]